MPDDGRATIELQRVFDSLCGGEVDAADALVTLAYDRLRALTRLLLADYRSLRRWEQTDDVLQNSALRLRRALETVRPVTVRTFFAIAALQIRREVIDLSRRHNGRRSFALGEYADSDARASAISDLSDPTDGPLTLIEWGEFHSSIEKLPEKQREVFDLLYYNGLSQEEAATVLGIDKRSVKRRWRSAKLALFEAMDGRRPGA